VFKKTFTKPLPSGAETFVRKGERLARWKDRRAKMRTAPVTVGNDGAERIILESPYYVAKYRDGAGVVQIVATGCRDEQAARRVLADLERRAELVRSGVITAGEDGAAQHQGALFAEHLEAYLASLEAAGACPEHRKERRRQLRRLAVDCGWRTLADLRRDGCERWVASHTRNGMGARTRNSYLTSAVAFGNWAVETGRLLRNPFDRIPRADEKVDPRRQRRAMTETELGQLLNVARERPLLDALTVRKGPRKGERYADVRPEVRQRLELLGRERALIYKSLLLTGLRKGELASLTVASLHLDADVAFAQLAAADEKNREGNAIPIRNDLAGDIRQWLADKLARLQAEAVRTGAPIPARLPPDAPLFDVPDKLCKILNRDLRLAGIPKSDDRGRVLDVHALRHTFGTLLSKGGVAPRTAQAAMRHSKIDLTMTVYTDPKLLDVRGALDALPALSLEGDQADRETIRATGTEGDQARTLAPTLAPTGCKRSQSESIAVNLTGQRGPTDGTSLDPTSLTPVKRKDRLSYADNRPSLMGATGLEPVTPSVSKYSAAHRSFVCFLRKSRHFSVTLPRRNVGCKRLRKTARKSVLA
jgi:integrase